MTEPSIEKDVEQLEYAVNHGGYPTTAVQIRALIASWRERGEEVKRLQALADERSLVQSIRVEGLVGQGEIGK